MISFYWDYVEPLLCLLKSGTIIKGKVFVKDEPSYNKEIILKRIIITTCGSCCDCERYKAVIEGPDKQTSKIDLDHIKLNDDVLEMIKK